MDKYEYRLKTEEMLNYVREGEFGKAEALADSIDWRRVRSVNMLSTVSGIYEENRRYQDAREILFIAYERAPGNRKVVYDLCRLAILAHDMQDAHDCYEEYVSLAPNDPNRYLLEYELAKVLDSNYDRQIQSLERYKDREYVEKWAYELAELYSRAGMIDKCIQECDDIALWFSDGKYVKKAMELKKRYKPLTERQLAAASKDRFTEDLSEVQRAARIILETERRVREEQGDVPKVANETVGDPEEETAGKAAEPVREEAPAVDNAAAAAQAASIISMLRAEEDRADNEAVEAGESKEAEIEETEKTEPAEADDDDPDLRFITDPADYPDEDEEEEYPEGPYLEEPSEDNYTEELPAEEAAPDEEEEHPVTELIEDGKRVLEVLEGDTKALAKALMKVAMAGNGSDFIVRTRKPDPIAAVGEASESGFAGLTIPEVPEAAAPAEAGAEAVEEAAEEAVEEAAVPYEEEETYEEDLSYDQAGDDEDDEVFAEDDYEDLPEDVEEEPEEIWEDDEPSGEDVKGSLFSRLFGRKQKEDEEILEEPDEGEWGLDDDEPYEEEFEEAEEFPEEAEEGPDEAAADDVIPAGEDQAPLSPLDEITKIFERIPDEEGKVIEPREPSRKHQRTSSVRPTSFDTFNLQAEIAKGMAEIEAEMANEKPADLEEDLEKTLDDETAMEELRLAIEPTGNTEKIDLADLPDDEFYEPGMVQEVLHFEDYEDKPGSAGSADKPIMPEDLRRTLLEVESAEKNMTIEELEQEEAKLTGELHIDAINEAVLGKEAAQLRKQEEMTARRVMDKLSRATSVEMPIEEVLSADAEYAAAAHAAQDALYDAFAIRMPSVPEVKEEETPLFVKQPASYVKPAKAEAPAEEEAPAAEAPEEKPVQAKTEAELSYDEAFDEPYIPEEIFPEDEEIEEIMMEVDPDDIVPEKEAEPEPDRFVIKEKFDLEAQSHVGTQAGLTEDEKKIFSYFVPVRGMSEQIFEVLENDRFSDREGTSRTGNLLVMGQQGSGKTALAIDVVKAIQKNRRQRKGKVAIISAEALNGKDIHQLIRKMNGGSLIIEQAADLDDETIYALNEEMGGETGELLVVLEDEKTPMTEMLLPHSEFSSKFNLQLEVPIFVNDELVTFGQTYAKEHGYRIDEMGILALYSRIDMMQREDHAVTIAEVAEIMDTAFERAKRAGMRRTMTNMFKSRRDGKEFIPLMEEDFLA